MSVGTEITRMEHESESLLLSVTPETVVATIKRALSLKVTGLDDKKGLAEAKETFREIVKLRTTCEKEHKAVKEGALRECQRIDKSRRDTLALLAPAEEHVKKLASMVEREQERLKKEAEDNLLAKRLEDLREVGGTCAESALRSMPATEFELMLSRFREEARLRKEDQERRDTEAKRLKAEQDKLAADRAEFDRKQREQEAETARLKKIEDDKRAAEQEKLDEQRRKIEADQKRLDDEAADRQRKIDDERLKTEAAERSRVETEARLKREADEAERTRLAKEAADRRELAMRPDREKLLAVADAVDAIELPGELQADSACMLEDVKEILSAAARLIRNAVNKSTKA